MEGHRHCPKIQQFDAGVNQVSTQSSKNNNTLTNTPVSQNPHTNTHKNTLAINNAQCLRMVEIMSTRTQSLPMMSQPQEESSAIKGGNSDKHTASKQRCHELAFHFITFYRRGGRTWDEVIVLAGADHETRKQHHRHTAVVIVIQSARQQKKAWKEPNKEKCENEK